MAPSGEKCSRLKTTAKRELSDDLSFPPPYSEQAKYLALADEFLSLNGLQKNVISTDSHKHFHLSKKVKTAA